MNNKITLILGFFATVFLASCSKDDGDSQLQVAYEITVEYPEVYGLVEAEGVSVTLKNLNTSKTYTETTEADGVARFTGLIPGNYTLSANQTLTAEEATALTGLEVTQELILNASLSELAILGSGNTTLVLEGGAVGDWLIKEFYYSGAPNSFYFYDAFIEIYNNSTETLFADGLMIGSTRPGSASTTSFFGFVTAGEQDAYIQTMLRVPGSGEEYPVEPGESIVIAVDGINHQSDPNGNENSPVNLGPGIADFEVYYDVNPNTPDTDNPEVPNMIIDYVTSTTVFDYLPGVMGSGLIIFRSEDPAGMERFTEPNTTSATAYVRVPKEDVIDALDAVANATVTPDRKRLPSNLDSGMATVGGTYTGTSLQRKVKQTINGRRVLVDTNNSSNDFIVNETPAPKAW